MRRILRVGDLVQLVKPRSSIHLWNPTDMSGIGVFHSSELGLLIEVRPSPYKDDEQVGVPHPINVHVLTSRGSIGWTWSADLQSISLESE